MSVKMQVDDREVREHAREIKGALKRLANLAPALEVPAERFKSLVDRSFIESRAPDGGAWAPLAPSTLTQKRREGYSPKPLVRRGARGLQGSTVVEPFKRGIRFGANKPYAGYHQFGTEDMPARPFLPFVGRTRMDMRVMRSPQIDAIIEDIAERIKDYVFPGQGKGRGRRR